LTSETPPERVIQDLFRRYSYCLGIRVVGRANWEATDHLANDAKMDVCSKTKLLFAMWVSLKLGHPKKKIIYPIVSHTHVLLVIVI
jgi:hypothetical protein